MSKFDKRGDMGGGFGAGSNRNIGKIPRSSKSRDMTSHLKSPSPLCSLSRSNGGQEAVMSMQKVGYCKSWTE